VALEAVHFTGFLGPKLYTKTCLYTLPRDRDFVVDFLPEHPQILVCIGAGHGYKFAGLLGKILSELAIDSRTDSAIEPFTLRRAAITDHDFEVDFRI
jgi:sarcosine oxidase